MQLALVCAHLIVVILVQQVAKEVVYPDVALIVLEHAVLFAKVFVREHVQKDVVLIVHLVVEIVVKPHVLNNVEEIVLGLV